MREMATSLPSPTPYGVSNPFLTAVLHGNRALGSQDSEASTLCTLFSVSKREGENEQTLVFS